MWFPINYLIVEALERYYHFYGDTFLVECPTGSGVRMNLLDVSLELTARLSRLFLRDRDDEHVRDLLLFHEYFHGETGLGLGASHQTGWTALVTRLLGARPERRACV